MTPSNDHILVFTWNLGIYKGKVKPKNSDRLDACVEEMHRLFSKHEKVIACIQEVPWTKANPTREFQDLFTSADRTKTPWVIRQQSHHVAMVFKGFPAKAVRPLTEIRVDLKGGKKKAYSTSIDGLFVNDLQIVGVHLPDRRTYPAGTLPRIDLVNRLMREIRNTWRETNPFIVLGDFNENPFDSSVGARNALYATRDRHDADRAARLRLGDKKPALYNPMWRLLPERHEPPHGSYEHDDSDYVPSRWNLFDQVITSSNLSAAVEVVAVLSTLDTRKLADADGIPLAEDFSDHLPVGALLRFRGKPPAKATP